MCCICKVLQDFAPRLHIGHLACFHTTNSSNYIVHLFLAEVTRGRKVLNQVSKHFEIRIHSHTKYRRTFLHLWFSQKIKKKQLWTLPNLTDHINSWPWNKIHNASQKSLSQDLLPDLFLMLGLFWDGLVKALSLLSQLQGVSCTFSLSYKDTACNISVFVWPLLFVMYLFNWTEVIMVLPAWVNHTKKECACVFLYDGWATHTSLE